MNKILFLSFNFPPDKSAGAKRTFFLVKQMTTFDKPMELNIVSSKPRRYGNKTKLKDLNIFKSSNVKVNIFRLWIPYLGDSILGSLTSYIFYALQVLPLFLFINPDIIYGTSAKLFTAFISHFLYFPWN